MRPRMVPVIGGAGRAFLSRPRAIAPPPSSSSSAAAVAGLGSLPSRPPHTAWSAVVGRTAPGKLQGVELKPVWRLIEALLGRPAKSLQMLGTASGRRPDVNANRYLTRNQACLLQVHYRHGHWMLLL